MSRRRASRKSSPATFLDVKADYNAAKSSRFRRVRTGVSAMGSGADYHYATESDFLRIVEQSRDMDRNDSVAGHIVDVAVRNTVQEGFTLNPQTGDKDIDEDLKARWLGWSTDARQCDDQQEMTFGEIEEKLLRAMLVDGDIFVLPTLDGTLEVLECHRCRTPTNTKRNVVHGVLLDERRRRQSYWFTKRDEDLRRAVTRVGDTRQMDAFDGDGEPNVYQIVDPKRMSQTRGVSALTPVFDMAGMFEDLNFAKLVQSQVASCIAILRERSERSAIGSAGQYGPSEVETYDTLQRTIEELAPGMEVAGAPGEKLTGFSPNVPNTEFFQHVRLILSLIGVNLGVPLVLLLMDASETNFSGWRGAVDQARLGFKRNQNLLKRRFHQRAYRWKVRQWLAEDGRLRDWADGLGTLDDGSIYKHRWNAPRWPYVQPLHDAQTDALRLERMLTSPRRLHAERGQDYDEIAAETVGDHELAFTLALEARDRLKERWPDDMIDFREFLHEPKINRSLALEVEDEKEPVR